MLQAVHPTQAPLSTYDSEEEEQVWILAETLRQKIRRRCDYLTPGNCYFFCCTAFYFVCMVCLVFSLLCSWRHQYPIIYPYISICLSIYLPIYTFFSHAPPPRTLSTPSLPFPPVFPLPFPSVSLFPPSLTIFSFAGLIKPSIIIRTPCIFDLLPSIQQPVYSPLMLTTFSIYFSLPILLFLFVGELRRPFKHFARNRKDVDKRKVKGRNNEKERTDSGTSTTVTPSDLAIAVRDLGGI